MILSDTSNYHSAVSIALCHDRTGLCRNGFTLQTAIMQVRSNFALKNQEWFELGDFLKEFFVLARWKGVGFPKSSASKRIVSHGKLQL